MQFPKPKDSQTFPEDSVAKQRIRLRVYIRDECRCVDCGMLLRFQRGYWNSMHLMHRKSKGSGGDWSMENLATGCLVCHEASHNAGGKPCPPKPRA
jgi:5-methylcytosine-specific restriction endonuclease McrA